MHISYRMDYLIHLAAKRGHSDVIVMLIEEFHQDPKARSKVFKCLNLEKRIHVVILCLDWS